MSVSVIIPTLEEEKYLPLLLADLKKQTIKPNEIIVVDAGSKDNTVEIARKNGAKVIISKVKIPATQRNLGAKMAKGDVLIFVDADIRLRDTNSIQEAVQSLISCIAVTARVDVIKEERTLIDQFVCFPSNVISSMFPRFSGRGAFMVVRKSSFKQVGGFDERRVVTEDLDLFRRLAHIGKVGCLTARVEESARRYRRLGHLHVIWSWFSNGIYAFFTNHSKDVSWRPVR